MENIGGNKKSFSSFQVHSNKTVTTIVITKFQSLCLEKSWLSETLLLVYFVKHSCKK